MTNDAKLTSGPGRLDVSTSWGIYRAARAHRLLSRRDIAYSGGRKQDISVWAQSFTMLQACKTHQHCGESAGSWSRTLGAESHTRVSTQAIPAGCTQRIRLCNHKWPAPFNEGALQEVRSTLPQTVSWLCRTGSQRPINEPTCISPDKQEERLRRECIQWIAVRKRILRPSDFPAPKSSSVSELLKTVDAMRCSLVVLLVALGEPARFLLGRFNRLPTEFRVAQSSSLHGQAHQVSCE